VNGFTGYSACGCVVGKVAAMNEVKRNGLRTLVQL